MVFTTDEDLEVVRDRMKTASLMGVSQLVGRRKALVSGRDHDTVDQAAIFQIQFDLVSKIRVACLLKLVELRAGT